MSFFKRPTKQPLQFATTLLLSAIWLVASNPLQAGEIVLITWSSGVGSIAGEFIGPLVAPNNDDAVGPSPNKLVVTQKDYLAIGPVDVVFTVVPSGGVTEYLIEEGVSNGTGLDWSGYRLELGFGVGAGFTPSLPGDELDFDSPDFNTTADFTTYFSTLTESEDVLLATGGLLPAGGFSLPPFIFSVDVPDGITEFTIRQTPIAVVPEPSTALLAGLGLAFMVSRLRRQK